MVLSRSWELYITLTQSAKPVGLLPVISSRSTTPKEKTSDSSVSCPVAAYSGARYLCISMRLIGSGTIWHEIHIPISALHKTRKLRFLIRETHCDPEICNLHEFFKVSKFRSHFCHQNIAFAVKELSRTDNIGWFSIPVNDPLLAYKVPPSKIDRNPWWASFELIATYSKDMKDKNSESSCKYYAKPFAESKEFLKLSPSKLSSEKLFVAADNSSIATVSVRGLLLICVAGSSCFPQRSFLGDW